MVKHIVFFKLSQGVAAADKNALLKKMQEIYSPLGKQLNYVIEFRTGINLNETSNAWDFVIDSVFKSKEDLQRYQESKEHQEAIRKGSVIEKTRAVIDYEF